MFQMRRESDGFVLPPRQSDERADAEPAKSCGVTAFRTIEPKIEIAFWSRRMHLAVDFSIISFLINNQPFCASIDNRNVILHLQRTDLDLDRRKIGRERAD